MKEQYSHIACSFPKVRIGKETHPASNSREVPGHFARRETCTFLGRRLSAEAELRAELKAAMRIRKQTTDEMDLDRSSISEVDRLPFYFQQLMQGSRNKTVRLWELSCGRTGKRRTRRSGGLSADVFLFFSLRFVCLLYSTWIQEGNMGIKSINAGRLEHGLTKTRAL
ncbi:hypothetical protein ACLOJK_023397 [Asimina triloba]